MSSSFDISAQASVMSTSNRKKEIYERFFSDEYKLFQEMHNFQQRNQIKSDEVTLTLNNKKKRNSSTKNSFDLSLLNDDIQKIKMIQYTQRFTNHDQPKQSKLQKQITKLKETLQEKQFELIKKYNIENEKNIKDLPEIKQIQIYEEQGDLLLSNIDSFLIQDGKKLDTNLCQYISQIVTEIRQNQQNLVKFTKSFLQQTQSKISYLQEKIQINSDIMIKQNTEQTKADILNRLYLSGYQQYDRDQFIQSVDQFLKSDTLLPQMQMMATSKEKLKNVNFSGVTQSLDELYELMLAFQDQSKYFSQSEEQSINTHAFRFFQNDMQGKLKSVQLQTAKKVMKRLQKNTQFKDQEVQCSAEEQRLIIQLQVDDLSKKVDEYELQNKLQESRIVHLLEENSKANQEKFIALSKLRETQDKIQVQDAIITSKITENENLQFQIFQAEKKTQSMYTEVEQLNKNISEMGKKILIQDTELDYLRQSDAEIRAELKQLKQEHNQRLRELRKAQKKLLKLGNIKENPISNTQENSVERKDNQQSNADQQNHQKLNTNKSLVNSIHSQIKSERSLISEAHKESQRQKEHDKIREIIKHHGQEAAQEYITQKLKQAIAQRFQIHKQASHSSIREDHKHPRNIQRSKRHSVATHEDRKNSTQYSQNSALERQDNLGHYKKRKTIVDPKEISRNVTQQQQTNFSDLPINNNNNTSNAMAQKIQQSLKDMQQSHSRQKKHNTGQLSKQPFQSKNKQGKSYINIENYSRSQSPESIISGNELQNLTKSIYMNKLSNDESSLRNLESLKNMLSIPENEFRHIKISNIQIVKHEASTQTDLYDMLLFFFDFINKVDQMLQSGQLEELFIKNGLISKQEQIQMKLGLSESSARLQKLQKYLAKISSLSNKGGDVFFRSICHIFQAQPHVFRQDQIDRYIRDKDKNQYQAMLEKQNQYIKVKHSVGGGYVKK